MDEILLLDATERYLKGEMNADEKSLFDQLRQTNPEVDQLVVEHSFFLQELDRYSSIREVKHSLQEVHNQLLQDGAIKDEILSTGAQVVNIWKRYKRTITIAASIAGITALSISAITLLLAPKNNSQQILELGRKYDKLNNAIKIQDNKINNIERITKLPSGSKVTGGGSAFLVDGKGYLITNAHVISRMKNIYIENRKGDFYLAEAVYTDKQADLALLKITDTSFKAVANLPYSIKKTKKA